MHIRDVPHERRGNRPAYVMPWPPDDYGPRGLCQKRGLFALELPSGSWSQLQGCRPSERPVENIADLHVHHWTIAECIAAADSSMSRLASCVAVAASAMRDLVTDVCEKFLNKLKVDNLQ